MQSQRRIYGRVRRRWRSGERMRVRCQVNEVLAKLRGDLRDLPRQFRALRPVKGRMRRMVDLQNSAVNRRAHEQASTARIREHFGLQTSVGRGGDFPANRSGRGCDVGAEG